MNDYKTIKKIFSLAYYDFSNNFTNWLSISGLHAIIFMLIFSALSYSIGSFEISYWASISNLFLDFVDRLHELFYFDYFFGIYFVGKIIAGLISCFILCLPLLIIQNSLDLAFDSSMRGMQIVGSITSYLVVMIAGHGLIVVLQEIIDHIMMSRVHGVANWQSRVLVIFLLILSATSILTSFLVVYFLQFLYVLVMHLLEYKKNIKETVQETKAMLQGKVGLVTKIFCLQVCIAAAVYGLLYFCLGTVIDALMPFITFVFKIMQLKIHLIFEFMMYNFFYTWSYFLLFSWICLVTAHLYRQLVCPPIENVSCSSCKDC